MRRITFITGNRGKYEEVRRILEPIGYEVVQKKIPYPEIQAGTLEEVARFGAEWLAERVEGDFIIDDSGLFIHALGGFPGVYSAYVYRTLGCEGILKLMDGVEDRRAEFRAVFALRLGGEIHIFAGVCPGRIAGEMRGTGGFGYDPIFVPEGEVRTFAEMSTEEKNSLSHRGRAVRALGEYLKGCVRPTRRTSPPCWRGS